MTIQELRPFRRVLCQDRTPGCPTRQLGPGSHVQLDLLAKLGATSGFHDIFIVIIVIYYFYYHYVLIFIFLLLLIIYDNLYYYY